MQLNLTHTHTTVICGGIFTDEAVMCASLVQASEGDTAKEIKCQLWVYPGHRGKAWISQSACVFTFMFFCLCWFYYLLWIVYIVCISSFFSQFLFLTNTCITYRKCACCFCHWINYWIILAVRLLSTVIHTNVGVMRQISVHRLHNTQHTYNLYHTQVRSVFSFTQWCVEAFFSKR